jgi:hypothetical protein
MRVWSSSWSGGRGNLQHLLAQALKVLFGDFAVGAGNSDFGATLNRLDMGACDAHEGCAEVHVRHRLRVMHRLLNRHDRLVDIDDHPLAQSAAGGDTVAHHLERIRGGGLRHQAANFGRADIERNNRVHPRVLRSDHWFR